MASAIILTMLLNLFVATSVQALTSITNTTSGGSSQYAPLNLHPGWRFTAKADTVPSEAVCVEVHPLGDAGNYVRAQCVLSGGTTPYDWTCNVFTNGMPLAFQVKTVQYQFHAATFNTNCQGNAYGFTGFNWNFDTDPLAVSLQSLRAEPDTASLNGGIVGLIAAIGGMCLLVLARLRKLRR
jgi:hypothetical protein